MTNVHIGTMTIHVEVFRHYDGGLGGPMLTLETLIFGDADVFPVLLLTWRRGMKEGHRTTDRLL